MRTVWKYPLEITDRQVLTIPRGAQFLSVVEQDGTPMLYALIDSDSPKKPYEVFLRGTDNPIDEAYLRFCDFLGTVKMPDGFVWHIFIEM